MIDTRPVSMMAPVALTEAGARWHIGAISPTALSIIPPLP
jgi:hypothetical protein